MKILTNTGPNSNLALTVTDGEFTWTYDEANDDHLVDPFTSTPESITGPPSGLHDINLKINKSDFVIITGLIGSGKSSLLQALAGIMPKVSGELNVNGSMIYGGVPWIQNATVRENIVFGLPFDQQKYSQVVDACCLASDFKQLIDGEFTFVGEKGITLSGGQKARINLARLVYAGSDIVLLDDVLSAVDSKVAKSIMNKCINGLLKNKTRVLATHQLSLIKSADKMIFMNGDGTVDTGKFGELNQHNEGFRSLLEFAGDQSKENKLVKVETTRKVETFNDNANEEFSSDQHEITTNGTIAASTYSRYLNNHFH
ncbi:unnamed protein product [Ambrosiozyma monospora]|uniref:Unnamed protein product n=1 Tax=Ambrosiozyma monospora TaxID=43982 RepID=A0ACB5UA03_AMBMO|nr:unnamed protein product [Ambrosiozyma monospora]